MHADSKFELSGRPMSYPEILNLFQQRQRHSSDFSGVKITIPNGQTRHHHVCVANCFDLKDIGETNQGYFSSVSRSNNGRLIKGCFQNYFFFLNPALLVNVKVPRDKIIRKSTRVEQRQFESLLCSKSSQIKVLLFYFLPLSSPFLARLTRHYKFSISILFEPDIGFPRRHLARILFAHSSNNFERISLIRRIY